MKKNVELVKVIDAIDARSKELRRLHRNRCYKSSRKKTELEVMLSGLKRAKSKLLKTKSLKRVLEFNSINDYITEVEKRPVIELEQTCMAIIYACHEIQEFNDWMALPLAMERAREKARAEATES